MEQRNPTRALSLEGEDYRFEMRPGSFGEIPGFLTREFSFGDSLR